MAEGLNRVMLIGNLGADPELRYTQGGQGVLNLRLATSESYANKSGERQTRTEWHNVVVWGNRAEALNKFLSKGRSICVEGRIQYRQWEDRDGNKRTNTDIIATNVVLISGGRSGGGDYESGNSGHAGSSAPPNQDFGAGDDFSNDDVPF